MSEHLNIAAAGRPERVALYVRVSTREQTVENQLLPLRDYARSRGWVIAEEFSDAGVSGALDHRPALNKLMEAARKRRVDRVMVARLDRLGRTVKHLLLTLEEFRVLGVQFCSLAESMDTATPVGKMAFTLIAAVAEFERELIRERIFAGLNRAKAQGKRLGRPRKAVDDAQVLALRQQGLSLRQIGRTLGISKDAVANVLSVMGSKTEARAPSKPAPGNGPSA
ncbi:MAG: recombinase family protein [Elusimicrobia bacterium]|nr:recombinase family protein [Elusimicrobiota bacterium]